MYTAHERARTISIRGNCQKNTSQGSYEVQPLKAQSLLAVLDLATTRFRIPRRHALEVGCCSTKNSAVPDRIGTCEIPPKLREMPAKLITGGA